MGIEMIPIPTEMPFPWTTRKIGVKRAVKTAAIKTAQLR